MLKRTVLWIGIAWGVFAPAAFAQVSVVTEDGLALRFVDNGDLAGVDVDGRRLPDGGIVGGFYVSEVSGEDNELLANGSLERDDDGDGVPDGCFFSEGVWKRDNAVARTGRWSMKAEVPGLENGHSGSFGAIVPVEGGATYVASIWVKSKGLGGKYASSGYVQERDENDKITTDMFQHQMHGSITSDCDWKRLELVLTTKNDTRQLLFRTNIYRAHGILWADDFSLRKVGGSPKHLATRATATEAGVRLRGSDPDRGLEIEATWKPAGGMLRLEGRVRSTTELDRCLHLSYRVPLWAEDGAWGADIGVAEQVKAGGRYSTTAPFGSFGPYSIYPFSSVVIAGKTAAFSLGVPMDPPRPFRLSYATDRGLAVEWDFGLSSLPERFPRSADFHAVLYRHDPEWGFRSAAARYYELFPEYFEVRVRKFGLWYICDLSTLDNPQDFGLAYNEHVKKGSVRVDHQVGNMAFRYTEPWGWWGWAIGLRPDANEPAPTYDELMAYLTRVAADKEALTAKGRNHTKAAHSILNSGAWDENGKYAFTRKYVPRWGGYNWVLNPSPYAVDADKLSRFSVTYDWEVEPGLALGADGAYLDSITRTWSVVPNYRPEHLRRTHHPLTFSPLVARPAQLGVWNQYEFVKHLADDLHGRGKMTMANIFRYNWVFFNHLLDVMGHETGGPSSLPEMRAERTLAYHKPFCWLMTRGDDFGQPEDREKWMQAAMLYGIAPTVVGGSKDPTRWNRWRPLHKKYMPVIIALCEAGWEPVTYATAEPADVLLERFGPRDGTFYLTARNPGEDTVAVTFTVDTAALKIDAPAKAIRLPGRREIGVKDGRFQDTLEPGVTCAYHVVH